MKKHFTIIFTLCALSFGTVVAQKRILLLNGFLHLGNEKTIESSAVGLSNGKVSIVRNVQDYAYSKQDWDTIIDLKGQHIYPGFVAANSTLGLTEIDAVRATRDFDEVGEFNPHIRSQIAYNAESKVIATVRTNGVLLAQATPRGGSISGSSSVMATFGWNWEDATLLSDDGIHVNWPSAVRYNWEGEGATRKKNEHYDKEKAALVAFFEMALAYSNLQSDRQKDIRLAAMVDCFKGTKRVYFHADDIQQLLDVIDFSQKFKLPYPVIIGGYESYLVTKRLSDAKIPVLLTRIHSLPENETDPVDLPYRLPKLLQDGGVLFGLQPQGDMEAMNARNVPFYAGTAWAYGLTEEQAIASVSRNICQIIGIGQSYGTIEEGKSATLFVSTGNALDMRTNRVTMAFLNGESIDLLNTQEELYRKYLTKYKK
jgi:imidazolonepropionase-like amidohydrolase